MKATDRANVYGTRSLYLVASSNGGGLACRQQWQSARAPNATMTFKQSILPVNCTSTLLNTCTRRYSLFDAVATSGAAHIAAYSLHRTHAECIGHLARSSEEG
jgi:hypothetical protein